MNLWSRVLISLFLISSLGAVLLASYGLSLLGEPQSVWLWRDMFGVLQ